MTYKESITAAMTEMATDQSVVFIGYGIRYGRAMGTLKNVSEAQLIETPVAENLMVGLAIGMALAGLRPLVYIERSDFLLNALDAIVNHLDAMHRISRGEFEPAVILRVVVGNREKPLYTGPTHTQDFSAALESMVSFPVRRVRTAEEVEAGYACAIAGMKLQSMALFEYKDLM